MLEFDAATTEILERAYQGADFARRRRASFDALAPGPSDHILDIGCGNGLMTAELALAVGSDGQVSGIDSSAQMLEAARARVSGMPWVTFHEAQAGALPLLDQSADGAVALQVFEYIADIGPALAEAARVLRPGARLVIGDMLFSTLHWASDDPGLMERMDRSWASHVAHRDLPALLPPAMAEAGFAVEDVRPLTFLDHRLRPDGLAAMMLILMERFAVTNRHVTPEEARVWSEEQIARAASGRFHFALTHVVTTGRRL
ncbi:methyltransferase domain-containing protein [Ponticoccus sp. SC2-23]|uniref:methyltransferase domain-containing protein n=1 Tax=Alexandriicola marinus TaxID=2081710 RepID=UPI000FDBBD9E|nr:methyltransferase domain-containing protein [Alexandriicola marinus]MBM1219468.1 methyltransferase domain-containing protein [Ponticoccus sp. SC6-9]MBM1223460.1 methyltransferase domain-containing protein [Ponticoccus sp. SC6-15]MBM1229281.1 methyltransferase domain-containing protein [Ponticoccus sp. SC6-38]MBM1232426.1 methyltransferase domain-containing protein [Ponticoccus sp. SC6-45]MBM1237624.1 methyltransferase domain-containing protein [Ponticoccus sp. SC6-49]MBM1241437.1 methyltra